MTAPLPADRVVYLLKFSPCQIDIIDEHMEKARGEMRGPCLNGYVLRIHEDTDDSHAL